MSDIVLALMYHMSTTTKCMLYRPTPPPQTPHWSPAGRWRRTQLSWTTSSRAPAPSTNATPPTSLDTCWPTPLSVSSVSYQPRLWWTVSVGIVYYLFTIDSSGSQAGIRGLLPDNDRRRSIHYPSYYTATCQNEKITQCLFTVYLLPTLVVLIIREIIWKMLTSLSNRVRWGW